MYSLTIYSGGGWGGERRWTQLGLYAVNQSEEGTNKSKFLFSYASGDHLEADLRIQFH